MAREKTQIFSPFSFFRNLTTKGKTHLSEQLSKHYGYVEDPEIKELCKIAHERSKRVDMIEKEVENFRKETTEKIDQMNKRDNFKPDNPDENSVFKK